MSGQSTDKSVADAKKVCLGQDAFIAQLLGDSQTFGPKMPGVFIVEAIRFYSEAVTRQGEPEEDSTQPVDPKFWYSMAVNFKARFEENFL